VSDLVERTEAILQKLASSRTAVSLAEWDEVSNSILNCIAEIARLREEVGRLGRDNNALKYGPEHFGGRMHQQVIDDLRADLDDARTALADAQAVWFSEGVKAAAKAADSFLMVQTGLDVERVLDCTTAIRAIADARPRAAEQNRSES